MRPRLSGFFGVARKKDQPNQTELKTLLEGIWTLYKGQNQDFKEALDFSVGITSDNVRYAWIGSKKKKDYSKCAPDHVAEVHDLLTNYVRLKAASGVYLQSNNPYENILQTLIRDLRSRDHLFEEGEPERFSFFLHRVCHRLSGPETSSLPQQSVVWVFQPLGRSLT